MKKLSPKSAGNPRQRFDGPAALVAQRERIVVDEKCDVRVDHGVVEFLRVFLDICARRFGMRESVFDALADEGLDLPPHRFGQAPFGRDAAQRQGQRGGPLP